MVNINNNLKFKTMKKFKRFKKRAFRKAYKKGISKGKRLARRILASRGGIRL